MAHVTVLHPPELGAAWLDDEIKPAAVRQLVRLLPRAGGSNSEVGKRHGNSALSGGTLGSLFMIYPAAYPQSAWIWKNSSGPPLESNQTNYLILLLFRTLLGFVGRGNGAA